MHFGRMRLRTLLALLVLTTLIPLGIFAGLLIGRLWQQQRAIVERQNVQTARAISLAIDQEVASGRSALQVLAALDIFTTLEPVWLNRLALRLMSTQPGWDAIVLADPSGRIVFDTELRPGGATSLGETEWIDAVVSKQRPSVSNLFHDPGADGYFFMIAVPVMDEGTLQYVLAAKVRSSSLSAILRRQRAPPGGVVSLADRRPRIMARTSEEAKYLGKAPSRRFQEEAARMSEGSYQGVMLGGIPSYSAISRSPITGWTVGVGLPATVIDTPLRRSIGQLVSVVVVLLGVGIASALILGRALVAALTSASAAARSLARGEAIEERRSRILEAQELAHSLLDAGAILSVRQQERDQALLSADAARREAEALSRSKDEFVATMSHELRTPLNAIYGWVRLLRNGKLDPQRHEHALEVIERNTRAQTQLIEDLLDMSRIVTGKLRLEMHEVDLATVLQRAVEGLRPLATAKEIEVSLAMQAGVGPISGDADRLRQIVWNLLMNSLKFTSKGGRIEVTLEAEGAEAVIRVADNGSGISPEVLPYIFERFRQGSSSAGRKHSGLGIGLALVRHLVEMHGGIVVGTSDGDGHGALFTVRLPLARARADYAIEAPRDASMDKDNSEARPLESLHVLIIEDDADAREMIATTLKQAGADVTSAASMPDALGLLDTLTPDVVVSDIAMPNGTGYEFLREMRRIPNCIRIPAIALTAYARPEDRARALEEGFHAHIGKPVEPTSLVHAIATAAGRS